MNDNQLIINSKAIDMFNSAMDEIDKQGEHVALERLHHCKAFIYETPSFLFLKVMGLLLLYMTRTKK